MQSDGSQERPRSEEGVQMRDAEEFVCRCEEVKRETIEQVIKEGALSLNAVKRLTRAGMGLCQGRTCRRLVSRLIAEIGGKSREDLPPPTVRPPVRPIPVRSLIKGEDVL